MAVGGDAVWRRPAAERIRRERILDAVVDLVFQRGVAGVSVGTVCERARVSRHTFYECFDGLDECLMAILDGALELAAPLITRAFADEGSWQDGMRSALASMLSFFDSEPALTRVCLVEMQAATAVVRDHREQILAAFRALVVARIESEVSHASPLAAEGTHASVIGIVNARLAEREQSPLIELLGPLMGIIVGPFMEELQVAQEIERGDELAREILEQRKPDAAHNADGPVYVPDVLLTARAHRARLCLAYVAGHPGVSNQQVAAGIGVSRREQVSRLLGKLAGLGLLVKQARGPGRANAWSATNVGERVAMALTDGGDMSPQ